MVCNRFYPRGEGDNTMKKLETALMLILLIVMLAVSLAPASVAEPALRRGGEILWQKGKTTLYQCGPNDADICLDNGHSVTKVYVAP